MARGVGETPIETAIQWILSAIDQPKNDRSLILRKFRWDGGVANKVAMRWQQAKAGLTQRAKGNKKPLTYYFFFLERLFL